jgi:hypothetical protein
MTDLSAILAYIADGTARWALNRVLDAALQTATGVSVGAKLDRLLASPFVAGESALHLAQRHPEGSLAQIEALRKARECFHHAAAQLTGLVRCHALYLAGICSDMLGDEVGRRYYYAEALSTIGLYYDNTRASHKSKAEKLATGGKAVLAGAAIVAPLPVIGWVKGLLLGAKGVMLLSTSRQMLDHYPDPYSEKMPAADFTVGELKRVLEMAVSE